MRVRLGVLGCALGLLPGLGLGAAALASAAAFEMPPAAAFAGGDQAQERVIDAVQRRFNARVVRVSETTFNGRPALELRLLSEQRVWDIIVDAATGRVLSGG